MESSNNTRDAVIAGCLESCQRLLQVVDSVTPEQFGAAWKGHNGIGPHLRHCFEHLNALRTGLKSGLVNYDARERNPLLETDPEAFADALEGVIAWLRALEPGQLDTPLAACQLPQVDAAPVRAASSLRRELLFVTSHTIHHLAVVTMLAELHAISLPDSLGVAYSTTAYERGRAARNTAIPVAAS